MNRMLFASAFAGACLAGPAAAVSPDDARIPYVGAAGEFVSVDSTRANDDGVGARLRLGFPLKNPASALEVSLYSNALERDLDGENDYQFGLFVDYVHDLSGYVGDLPVKPFVLAGLGLAEDDILANNDIHPAINAGGGVLVPLVRNIALRAEARYMAQFNSEHYADENLLNDLRFNVGVQIPLSWHFGQTASAPEKKECELTVIDPQTGRTDCVVDTDQDGVIDQKDVCPGTPLGTVVNASGCPLAQKKDTDGDGVTDTFDRCPDSAPGAKVDDQGCEEQEVVVLRGVTFETDSAVLTANAKIVLKRQAEKLKTQRAALVEVAGHTDSRGAAEYNTELSQARAQSVVDFLVAEGVQASRLTARGYGEFEPVASNETEEGRELNRRVELRTIAE
ncbi:MAG: hypothetical protein CMH65_07630 [Nevskiales bacterium]|nr:hypothetical protein [Nevskiales bacterium]